jgi:hypothetical protein
VGNHEAYLEWLDKLFDKKVNANTPEAELLQVALLLIKEYEDNNYSIPVPDPTPLILQGFSNRSMAWPHRNGACRLKRNQFSPFKFFVCAGFIKP